MQSLKPSWRNVSCASACAARSSCCGSSPAGHTPAQSPQMFVVNPDLRALAKGQPLPHIYHYDGPGVRLCLWLPRKNEWLPQMRLLETYVAWTSEWLNYFEEWLVTGEWAGGGEHPPPRKKRRLLRATRPVTT